MKKYIGILLVLALCLTMAACGSAPEAKEEPISLSVGFGRAKITPDKVVFMTGYGDDITRLSKGVLQELYVTCIAITDSTDKTIMLITADLLYADMHPQVRGAVVKATGVPFENIIYGTTHTHSGPKISDKNPTWLKQYYEYVAQAAKEAMDDRAPSTVSIGSKHVDNLTFVRHYNVADGRVMGDNFWSDGQAPVSHRTEADDTLQLISFQREGKKPVVMINWQGHATLSSTGMVGAKATREMLSSDYIGPCRDYVEAESDYLFAFFLSGSGNLNAYSRIEGEGLKDYNLYGQTLGQAVLSTLEATVPVQSGVVQNAKKIQDVKSAKGNPGQIEFYAMAAGDISFVNAPYEMFDTTAMAIKNNTPYKMTFVITVANGEMGYIPTQECWDYPGCYEVGSCYFARGTAEIMEKAYLDVLADLHG